MNENSSVTYRKDKNETVFAVRSDRQVQCLGEQIAYQTGCGVRGEGDGLISPISHHFLIALVHLWIYRRTSESDWTMPSERMCDAQAELAEGNTGKSVT